MATSVLKVGRPGPGPEEELLVADGTAGEAAGDVGLAVAAHGRAIGQKPGDYLATPVQEHGAVVELAALRAPLVERKHDIYVVIGSQPGEGLSGRPGHGLRLILPRGIARAGEVHGGRQLREDDEVRLEAVKTPPHPLGHRGDILLSIQGGGSVLHEEYPDRPRQLLFLRPVLDNWKRTSSFCVRHNVWSPDFD